MLRQRGAMFANQGNVAYDQGDLTEAEKDYREFRAISEKLCAQNPNNALWQRPDVGRSLRDIDNPL